MILRKGLWLMENKFSKNDTVVYGKNGICLVEDIKTMKFGMDSGTYYILKPMSNKASTVYVPVDKESLVSKMRGVLTKEQIDDILTKDCVDSLEWPENKIERNDIFSGIISRCDTRELLMLIKCLYLKKQEKQNRGKQLSSSDDGLLKMAEKLIDEEFSLSLGCSTEAVGEYIRKKLES